MKFRFAWLLVLTVIVSSIVWAKKFPIKKPSLHPGHKIVTPDNINWKAAPNALPAGAQLAVLEGDPMKAGVYTMRLKMPSGYRIPPHFHPSPEHVTVLSGDIHVGFGDKFDEKKGNEVKAGSFAVFSPGTHHYAWTSEETIIQLNSTGPWRIQYVNPSDDPRSKKK